MMGRLFGNIINTHNPQNREFGWDFAKCFFDIFPMAVPNGEKTAKPICILGKVFAEISMAWFSIFNMFV